MENVRQAPAAAAAAATTPEQPDAAGPPQVVCNDSEHALKCTSASLPQGTLHRCRILLHRHCGRALRKPCSSKVRQPNTSCAALGMAMLLSSVQA